MVDISCVEVGGLMLTAVAGLLVSAGLAVAAYVLLLPPPAQTGVARALPLAPAPPGVPDACARADGPASDRILRPVLSGLRRFGARITPVGTPQRLRRRLDLAGNT